MNPWVTIISAFFQLITMILKNKFEKDAEKKKEKGDLHEEAIAAIRAGNVGRAGELLGQLRDKDKIRPVHDNGK